VGADRRDGRGAGRARRQPWQQRRRTPGRRGPRHASL